MSEVRRPSDIKDQDFVPLERSVVLRDVQHELSVFGKPDGIAYGSTVELAVGLTLDAVRRHLAERGMENIIENGEGVK